MNEEKIIWNIIVTSKKIKYTCPECEWSKEYLYPAEHYRKNVQIILTNHLKKHKSMILETT